MEVVEVIHDGLRRHHHSLKLDYRNWPVTIKSLDSGGRGVSRSTVTTNAGGGPHDADLHRLLPCDYAGTTFASIGAVSTH